MDKKRSVLNVIVAVGNKIFLTVLGLVARRIVIQYAGLELNGVASLFSSILAFLSIADLGIGGAINFCLYKPVVDGDQKKVAALYNLYKKIYAVIAAVVLVVGLAIMPALPFLAKNYHSGSNLYLMYVLMLISTVMGYLYSCRVSLVDVHKNNYIITLIGTVGAVVRHALQIIVVIFLPRFEWYFAAIIVSNLVCWLIYWLHTRKHYAPIVHSAEKVDDLTKKEVTKNALAMFGHKVGGILVNTTDSMIISAFVGVTILGQYANYVLIMTSMTGLLGLFFWPLTAVIGHLCVHGSLAEQKKYFRFMYFLNFGLGLVFFLGYYAVIDSVAQICFGAQTLLDANISLVLTIDYFVQFMRNAILVYRDATGTFYYDRWKPFVEGILNVVLSILFALWWGIVGILLATIITSLILPFWVEPLVLYKHAFHEKPTKYYLLNYGLLLVFGAGLAVVHFCRVSLGNVWLDFLANGFIAVGLAVGILFIMFLVSKTFRENVRLGWRTLFKRHRQPAALQILPDTPPDNTEIA